MDEIIMKSWPAKTTITYGDAETRGQLRAWKKKLAERYQIFESNFLRADRMTIVADMVRGSTSTRQRAYERLAKLFGPGAFNEGVTLKRGKSLAIWSYLKPRNAVVTKVHEDASPEVAASLAQDCVCVNYIVAGTANMILADGLWTLEVPDHALGRAVERSRLLHPEVIIREAHANLLQLPIARANDIHYIKAGAGCFAGKIVASTKEKSYGSSIHVRVNTWLSDDMLGDNQIPLSEKGEFGKRCGDSIFLPRPLWPKSLS